MCLNLNCERQQHVYATPERKRKFLEEVDEEMDRQDAEDRGRRGAEICARRHSEVWAGDAGNQKLQKQPRLSTLTRTSSDPSRLSDGEKLPARGEGSLLLRSR